ncbi:hypothetical protein [Candidatus Marinarcus aquaticus]|uniref:Uncharacterized protein n=1 Tax=Candidatus Marinarcus aquaticus TaxID=2044504 RepID=A0A4Q0XS45_9BACT|nr:hypothetical protein [Candidatus Marinarcus aquaticus]RXJ58125.1 hypothetical protein CRV04_06355 [Candidatus Marinarcus aquaticus]
MVNINKTLKYDDTLTVDDYNQIIKDIFLKYFDNEDIFLQFKEQLRTELVNYVNHILNKDESEKLFEKIIKFFKDALSKNHDEVIQELASSFLRIVKTDELYMGYYINQPKNISTFTPRDFATYYFKTMDDIIEGCFKPRLELFFKIYKFNLDGSFPDISNKTFGDIVNLINDFDELIKDPIFNIPISQWRNISTHKDFTIAKENIVVNYGKKNNIKTQSLTHEQLKEITFWVNSKYGILRLAEVIIHLNIMEEIIKTEKYKEHQISLRSEQSLLGIIHNLQIVGFQFHSFNEIGNIFELNLYIKSNNDVKESIIHATQIFTQIAIALDNDEFQKDIFGFIQINILNKNEKTLASAKIDIKSCIDYSFSKIEMEDLIKKIEFEIDTGKI